MNGVENNDRVFHIETKNKELFNRCDVKRKLKFEHSKHRSEATQLGNKKNHSEKNEVDVDSLVESHKEFIKCNK